MNKYIYMISSTLLIGSLTVASGTQTSVVISNPSGKSQNEYGDTEMYQDISLETKKYAVEDFWGKFKFGGSSSAPTEAKTYDVSTHAHVKVTVELSFACKDGGLDESGCSSQKPFLLNEGVLDNPDMKLDSEGMPLNDGEYRIPFDAALNYDPANDDAFYSLDVFRDGIYYESPAKTGETAKSKNFFGYLVSLFKDYFSPDVATYSEGTGSPEQRNRYIANMTFGAQQDYRMKRSSAIHTQETNTADANKKVSLLDYNSQIIETTKGCKGLFFSYDPDSLTCKSRNFFGLSNFMPFVNNINNVKVKSDSVVEDTETTLLTLAGKLDNKNYVHDYTENVHGKKTVLQNIFKPVTFVAGSIFRFFFGNSSRNLTEIVSAEFKFDNPMPLTFIETDGNIVKKFRQFYLKAIESIYGTEVESCKVKETSGFLGFGSSYETYTAGVSKSNNPDFKISFFSGILGSNPSCSDFSELKNCKKYRPRFSLSKKIKIDMDETDWLSWCKRNQGRQKKGLFGRIFDTFTSIGNFLQGHSEYGTLYDQQLDSFLSIAKFSVKDYREKVHKGLILHLQSAPSDTLTPETKGTTTKFKIMKTTKGNSNTMGGNRGNSNSMGGM